MKQTAFCLHLPACLLQEAPLLALSRIQAALLKRLPEKASLLRWAIVGGPSPDDSPDSTLRVEGIYTQPF